jgi:hypothetical protein
LRFTSHAGIIVAAINATQGGAYSDLLFALATDRLPHGSPLLWVHYGGLWVMTLAVFVLFWIGSREYVKLRLKYLATLTPARHTVLVQGLPVPLEGPHWQMAAVATPGATAPMAPATYENTSGTIGHPTQPVTADAGARTQDATTNTQAGGSAGFSERLKAGVGLRKDSTESPKAGAAPGDTPATKSAPAVMGDRVPLAIPIAAGAAQTGNPAASASIAAAAATVYPIRAAGRVDKHMIKREGMVRELESVVATIAVLTAQVCINDLGKHLSSCEFQAGQKSGNGPLRHQS